MKDTNNLELRAKELNKLNIERNRMQDNKEQDIAKCESLHTKRKLQREYAKWIKSGRPLVIN